MTEDTMNLRGLLEKTADSDFLREMIGFSAQRLMELEVESLTGAPHGTRTPDASPTATVTANVTGRPAPAPSNCAFRSCGRAATSPAFSSRAGWPRKPSPQ